MKITIHRFEEATSTNDLAVARAREGGEEGEVFVADAQTAGRGRSGRRWESPKGQNLYLSLLLRPRCSPVHAPLLTLVAGAATFDLISAYLDSHPLKVALNIKWPNDVYLQGRKIAGILTEMESKANRVLWVVAGIGVDLNAEPGDFSPEVREIAGSLRIALGRPVDREEALNRLLEAFKRRYREFLEKGPAGLLAFCDDHSYLKGKRVSFDGGREGLAQGLSPEGHLLVVTEEGEMVPVVAGDVVVREK